MADLTEQLRGWSYRRQRLGRGAADPLEALRDVVAVYSSHPTAPLALLARSARLEADRFAALERERAVVRIPAMRQSIFLVPVETAARVFAATRLPLEQHAKRLQYAGLDWDEYAQLKRQVLELAREPLSPSEVQQAVKIGERTMVGVRVMASEGLVLRVGGSLRSDSLRYVTTEAWLGHPLEEADGEESLRWLAHAYLRGYGPARVKDFAWWSGVTQRRAAAALRGEGVADLGGGLLLAADDRAAFERMEPVDSEAVDLLPKWDAYTMGHAPDGRQRLVAEQHLPRAYSGAGTYGATSGDGLPLVLRGGQAVASWSHKLQGNRMAVSLDSFEPEGADEMLDERWFDEVGTLLGAERVSIEA